MEEPFLDRYCPGEERICTLNQTLPPVLLVEDDEDMIDVLQWSLEGVVRVFVARTVQEAEEAFGKGEFAAIIMDGHVKGDEPITVRLVRQMRLLKPRLKIIATSGDEVLRRQLMAAGCSESCEKFRVPEKLKKLMNQAA